MYQASSSEMFGKVQETPQTETTPFYPRSPYGVAKVYGCWLRSITVKAMTSSPVTEFCLTTNHHCEGLSSSLERLAMEQQESSWEYKAITSRNLGEASWGFAGDFVHAMWLMLQANKPDDYVIATGEQHSVRDFYGCFRNGRF